MGLQILMIEPLALFIIKLDSALTAITEVEEADQLVQRQYFPIVTGVPAQKGKKVENGFGDIAAFAVACGYFARLRVFPFEWENGEAETVAVALAQFAVSFGLQEQGEMGKLRHRFFPTETVIEQDVERCARQPFFAAYDMGDFHQMIVHDIRQMIGGQLVGGFIQYLIVQNGGIDDDLAAQKVVYRNRHIRLHLEAHNVLTAGGNQCLCFFLRKRQRVAHLQTGRSIILKVGGFAPLRFQLLRRVEGNISMSAVQKSIYIFLIYILALALAVGTVIAADADALVKTKSEPMKRLDDILLRSRHETLRIGIFYTKNEIPALLLGKQIIVQSRPDTADMQRTRRAGGKADSHLS
ncbi:hypothetical protein Barb4_04651 [Bacteroidales bacterium Barb4]|nr:hypothetical protein Barb4_04651 [Bacteroidales bacterium Barb4]